MNTQAANPPKIQTVPREQIPLCTQRSYVLIVDSRDGSRERLSANGITVAHAQKRAYAIAVEHCRIMNEDEGWQRFFALSAKACRRLGIA